MRSVENSGRSGLLRTPRKALAKRQASGHEGRGGAGTSIMMTAYLFPRESGNNPSFERGGAAKAVVPADSVVRLRRKSAARQATRRLVARHEGRFTSLRMSNQRSHTVPPSKRMEREPTHTHCSELERIAVPPPPAAPPGSFWTECGDQTDGEGDGDEMRVLER
jgi:hypothetical protein